MRVTSPTTGSLLAALTKARLFEIGREFSVSLSAQAPKDQQIRALEAGEIQIAALLGYLGRDELKAACRAHALDDAGRSRHELQARLLDALDEGAAPVRTQRGTNAADGTMPAKGKIVTVRRRQYLVEDVVAPSAPGNETLVKLACLDDDEQGRALEVLWGRELGARVMQPEREGLGSIDHFDPPRHFAAYLHALKWNSVTASDGRLFQAPFRAGIQVLNHQLAPLKKALDLPRVNLFIADDVGLGKTIEAGLVLQELILRQKVRFVLIVCPASICLQWRAEMRNRFGLAFEIYNRAFVARRRQERGFGVNPWATHSRFIISYQTLRRPEHRDPLLAHLERDGQMRVRKSLLILDEAHTAAPASATRYAVDSRITKVIRDCARRFENRLFLSATPHNGHSNSFSALLELLDPQRFTRGVPIERPEQLEPVMVRRLKTDLRELGIEGFPQRRVVQRELVHDGRAWSVRVRAFDGRNWSDDSEEDATNIGAGEPAELELAELLDEYTRLVKPTKGRGQLVFTSLQKRLLSSVEAFRRTLFKHGESIGSASAPAVEVQPSLPLSDEDDEYGADDETLEAALDVEIERDSRAVTARPGRAREILERMLALSEQRRAAADAKVLALLDWIRRHQCAAVRPGGAEGRGAVLRWTDRRVIIFTEYGDTKRYLHQLISAAAEGTDRATERLLQFHGGMSDEQREEVQAAFNAPPDEHPVRILIATDAAREGVNLQGRCADLFHFDLPWNPARMEQRNGRIDRTLQPEPEVRCHYFRYAARKEDVVLAKVVEKVEIIKHELGSLGTVVMDRMAEVLDRGIDAGTHAALEAAQELSGKEHVEAELESQRANRDKLRREIDEGGRILNRSRTALEWKPELLRDALDVGLELAGGGPLEPTTYTEPLQPPGAFRVAAMPASWQPTLDELRPPRARNEPFWEWRERPPRPVVFHPPKQLVTGVVQLHLQHAFVQRILERFRSQGFAAHDLARATVIRNPHDSLVRVIAFGRLSLFGPGAARLHDHVLSVAAQWLEGGDAPLRPFADEADKKAIARLEDLLASGPTLADVPASARARLLGRAREDFAALWPHVEAEADARAHDEELALERRGLEEEGKLLALLRLQRASIERKLTEPELPFGDDAPRQRQQQRDERAHMQTRLIALEQELVEEPAAVRSIYQVVARRLEPVGLVYLWPESRG